MGQLNMAATMDAIAEILIADVTPRVYPWPTETVSVPCVVIGYPTEIDYDSTFTRGSDRAVFPIFYVVGKAADRNSRDELSAVVAGDGSVKTALDGDLDGAVNQSVIAGCSITEITVNNVAYIAAKFDLEIYS